MNDPSNAGSEETVSIESRNDLLCDRYEFLLLAGQRVPVPEFLRNEGLDPTAVAPDLVRELERLADYYHPDNADNRPTVAGPVVADLTPLIVPGMMLAGRYALVRKIGGGGMGDVWLAQQSEPVERQVAVKVIKAELDSHEVLARFNAERQALAMMDHPNIARVLDGGVHAIHFDPGEKRPSVTVPFFVMELVNGVSITRYCDARKLNARQRLELFGPVCQAIQHAHQKGLIHRDIKPGNVLVTEFDGRPVPKVIDFGIAKAVSEPLAGPDRLAVSRYGMIIGTAEYMSPEQASGNPADIDTRSDVYSLGVLLYELLTGGTPVDRKSLARVSLPEMQRIVREEDAPRPSLKVGTGEASLNVAANRGTEPKKLAKLLRGDLDWVLLKSLEKDRGRRYDSPADLAAEVGRYLRNEPVEVGPPSAVYRMRKFVRRHRVPVVAAAAVFVALVGGIVGTTVGLLEAQRQAGKAEEARGKEATAATKARAAEAGRGGRAAGKSGKGGRSGEGGRHEGASSERNGVETVGSGGEIESYSRFDLRQP